ncbi:MAG: DUF4230 domain-containing protein [Clostridiales bacterium]|nr:DUF4230 domain-containing protein [Clostridiales bacterium]
MRKILTVVISMALILTIFCSCNKKEAEQTNKDGAPAEETSAQETKEIAFEPDEYQIRSICELATLKCYYHNTAKAVKSAGTGLTHLGEEDTPYWFEYTAQATFGIDGHKVQVVIDDDSIIVYMPHARILSIDVDPNSHTEPILKPRKWYRNDVEIGAQDITDALAEANVNLKKEIMADSKNFSLAEKTAQDLIQNYIDQITEMSGTRYKVQWKFLGGTSETEAETTETTAAS